MELDINDKLKQRFEATRTLYLNAVTPYVSDYSTHTEFVDLAEMRKNDEVLRRVQKSFPASFGVDITIGSSELKKMLEFNFSDGTNMEGMYYHSIDFSIRHGQNWFSLQDYFTHNGIDDKIDDFFDASDSEQAMRNIDRFIQQIVVLMERDDIKHILSTKDWINVPHDKSMYF